MNDVKSIVIHQAYYGEVEKSHSCIDITTNSEGLKSDLIAFTDRPNAIPPGINLKPYISGKLISNYYILTKTFPDSNSVRSGMVFTHALLIKQEDLKLINRFDYLLSLLLKEKPKKHVALEPINLTVHSKTNELPRQKKIPEYLKISLEQLLQGNTPVHFSGDLEAFCFVLEKIWNGAQAELRKDIKFKICFNPTDYDRSDKLTFVYIQKDTRSRWPDDALIYSENKINCEIESLAQRFLMGMENESSFDEFVSVLNVDTKVIPNLTLTEKAFNLYKDLATIKLSSITLLVRFIDKLSPLPNQGERVKNKILEVLSAKLSQGQHKELKSLRNLNLDSLPKGKEKISSAISKCLQGYFEKKDRDEVKEVAQLGILLQDGKGSLDWWNRCIKGSIKTILDNEKELPYRTVWKILNQSIEATLAWIKLIPNKMEIDDLLANSIPNDLKNNVRKEVIDVSKKRKWYLLHAKLTFVELSDIEAIKQQIILERNLKFNESLGLSYLVGQLDNERLLEIAIQEEDPKLAEDIGSRLIKESSFFSSLDFSNIFCCRIWAYSLTKTNNLDYGEVNTEEAIEQVFHHIISDVEVPKVILNQISESDYADLSNITNRSQIIDNLSEPYKSKFIYSTAKGIINKIRIGENYKGDLEDYILEKVKSEEILSDFFNAPAPTLTEVLNLYHELPNLKEDYLNNYLKRHIEKLPKVDSISLGNIVSELKFRDSARTIFDKAKSKSSYQPALNNCKNLVTLGLWDTISYGYLLKKDISNPTRYKAVEELAIELYPKGPETLHIWERSGGDTSKLENAPREQMWRQAISLIRKGTGGITATTLLKEMQKDFPNQSKINDLLKLF